VYRAEGSTGRFVPRNRDLILGAGTSSFHARYLFIDPEVTPGVTYAYLLEDVERTGKRMLHGPVLVTAGGDPAPPIDFADYDRVASPGGELSVAALWIDPGMQAQGPGKTPPRAPSRAVASAAVPDEAPRSVARVVSRDATGMVVEIKVPRVRLSPVVLDGAPYMDVSLKGFSHVARPGHPALPEVGVPVDIDEVADVRLEVEEMNTRRVGGPVLPAPAPDYAAQGDGSLLDLGAGPRRVRRRRVPPGGGVAGRERAAGIARCSCCG
jgi:hypothetical protein